MSNTVVVELYRKIQYDIDGIVLSFYQKSDTKEVNIDSEMYMKILENEDLAYSWLLSLASATGADLVKLSIKKNGSIYEYTYMNADLRNPIITLTPHLTQVHRVILMNTSITSSFRELVINVNEHYDDVKVVDLSNQEVYSFEVSLVKNSIDAIKDKLLLIETNDGVYVVDTSSVSIIKEVKGRNIKKRVKRRKRKHSKRRKKVRSSKQSS